MEGEQSFRDIERSAEQKYKSFGLVRCPYFNCDVHFSSVGFLHLMNKSDSRPRPIKDKLRRFALINEAVIVLKISRTVQEYSVRQEFVKVNISSRWEKRLSKVHYYAFIAIFDLSRRIRVVVREIEGGKKHFYSVHPIVMDRNQKTS